MSAHLKTARNRVAPVVWRAILGSSSINWAILDQALVSGTNFIYGVLLARSLGLGEYGRFALAWMVVQFAAAVQQSCIIDPMMSIAPKQQGDVAPAYFCAVMAQQLVLSIATALLTVAGMSAVGHVLPDLGITTTLSAALAVVCAAHMRQDFLRRYFFTIRWPNIAFLLDVLRYPTQFGLLAAVQWRLGSIDTTIALWLVAIAAVPPIVLGFCLWRQWRWDSAVQIDTLRRHWRFSRWMLPATLVSLGTGQAILTITGAVLGSAAVGALRAAQNLIGLLHILFQGMENFVPVAASSALAAIGYVGLRRYLMKATVAGALVSGIVIIAMNIDPSLSLRVVYGKAFEAAAADLLPWWSIVYIAIFLNIILISGLRATEATQVVLRATTWTTCVTLVLAYPLVSLYGTTGALICWFVAELVRMAIMARGSRLWLLASAS